jgi:hypothetical protein
VQAHDECLEDADDDVVQFVDGDQDAGVVVAGDLAESTCRCPDARVGERVSWR